MTHLQSQIKLLLRTEHGTTLLWQHLHFFSFVLFFNEKILKTNQKRPNITLTTRSYSRLRSDLSVTDVVIKLRKETKKKTDFERGIVCGMHHGAAPDDRGGHVWGSFSCGATSGAERSLRLHVRCPPFSRPLCSRIIKKSFQTAKVETSQAEFAPTSFMAPFLPQQKSKTKDGLPFYFHFFCCWRSCRQSAAYGYFICSLFWRNWFLSDQLRLWLTSGLIYTITEPFFFFAVGTLRRVYFTLREGCTEQVTGASSFHLLTFYYGRRRKWAIKLLVTPWLGVSARIKRVVFP